MSYPPFWWFAQRPMFVRFLPVDHNYTVRWSCNYCSVKTWPKEHHFNNHSYHVIWCLRDLLYISEISLLSLKVRGLTGGVRGIEPLTSAIQADVLATISLDPWHMEGGSDYFSLCLKSLSARINLKHVFGNIISLTKIQNLKNFLNKSLTVYCCNAGNYCNNEDYLKDISDCELLPYSEWSLINKFTNSVWLSLKIKPFFFTHVLVFITDIVFFNFTHEKIFF